jgi:hypothetical protein
MRDFLSRQQLMDSRQLRLLDLTVLKVDRCLLERMQDLFEGKEERKGTNAPFQAKGFKPSCK